MADEPAIGLLVDGWPIDPWPTQHRDPQGSLKSSAIAAQPDRRALPNFTTPQAGRLESHDSAGSSCSHPGREAHRSLAHVGFFPPHTRLARSARNQSVQTTNFAPTGRHFRRCELRTRAFPWHWLSNTGPPRIVAFMTHSLRGCPFATAARGPPHVALLCSGGLRRWCIECFCVWCRRSVAHENPHRR